LAEKQRNRMKLNLKLLLWGGLSITLWIGGMNYFVVHKATQTLQEQISKQLNGNVKLGVSKIVEVNNELTKVTQVIARNRYISKALHLLEGRGVNPILNDLISIYPYINYISVTEPDGTIFASSTRDFNGNKIAGEELLLKDLRTNAMYVKPITEGVITGSPGSDDYLPLIGLERGRSQWFSAPVKKRSEVIGWIVVSFDWQTEYNSLLHDIKSYLTATENPITNVLLINQQNTILACNCDTGMTNKSKAMRVGNKFKPNEPLIWQTEDVQFGGMTLKLVLVSDRDVLFKPIKEATSSVVLINIISALFLAALLSLVLRRTLLKRIDALHRGADIFGQGNLSYRIENLGSDELGILGGAFNQMAEKLKKITTSKKDLDQEIEERKRTELKLLELNNQLSEATSQAVEAHRKAELASQSKSDFLANMSHEIRTPMNGVLGMLGLLLGKELNGQQRHYAEVAQSSAKSLLSLINDILDFSKIEAGKLDIEIIDFNLHKHLNDLSNEIIFRAQEKELEFSLVIDESVPTHIQTDPGRLRQILWNITGNAIKFTSRGGVILRVTAEVLTKEDEQSTIQLQFSITDTGIGIPSDKVSNLFDTFSQVDESTTRIYGGTGLGLSIAKQLCRLMGGEINVTSHLNKGSCFTFTINALLPNKTISVLSKTSDYDQGELTVDENNTKPAHILLVEDNLVNQEVAIAVLGNFGHTVDVASNGQEAIDLLISQNTLTPYDLVLMDCMMPIMDGYEATHQIRTGSLVPTPSVTIIAMTANAMKGDKDKCINAGMNDYLTKPLEPVLLKNKLDKWLKRN